MRRHNRSLLWACMALLHRRRPVTRRSISLHGRAHVHHGSCRTTCHATVHRACTRLTVLLLHMRRKLPVLLLVLLMLLLLLLLLLS
jgi:hypothetical protein